MEYINKEMKKMNRLDPKKLHVEFREGVTQKEPVISRKYTLTHSDTTGELYLTVGLEYACDKINSMRDEVTGRWRLINKRNVLYINCYIGGGSLIAAIKRYDIFKKELPLAFEAIRCGDSAFFEEHKELDNSPIWVHFDSAYPFYNRLEVMGTPAQYR